jgi:iron complex transport system substrate-binding protein
MVEARRIASLLASATEILAALRLEDRLVAISHECDHPEHVLDRPRISRPRFDPAGLESGAVDRAVRQAMIEHGSVYEIDDHALADLRPELILTQAVCEVCAVPTAGVREAVQAHGLDARVLSLDAHSLDDIFESIETVGRAAGAADAARVLTEELRARISAVEDAVRGRARPRVLALEWLDPPFLPGHWVPEQIEKAGGNCIAGSAGSHSEQATWESLASHDPDVLIIMPCGYGLEAARRDADRSEDRLLDVAPRAVHGGRAFVVDGSSYFNRSGPRVVDGIEILGALLHPDAVARDVAGAAAVWGAPHAARSR